MANKHLWATPITANDSTPKEQLGIKRTEWSTTDNCFKSYRYGRAASDTTIANGTCLGFSDTLRQVFSSDYNDYDINQVAGVGTGTITANYYGWLQTGGYHSVVLTDAGNDIVDGDSIIISSGTTGVCDRTATAEAAVSNRLGVAVADDIDGDDTVAVFLMIDEV